MREHTPNTTYHLVYRICDREAVLDTDDDRELYTSLLARALARSDWRCLSYAVMPTHVQLAVVAGFEPLASWLGAVHSPFTDAFNCRRHRAGPVLARRPLQSTVAPDEEGTLISYIHNNPVRATRVLTARESTWTSHRAYLAPERAPPWLHVAEGLARAGFDDPDEFDAWVDSIPER